MGKTKKIHEKPPQKKPKNKAEMVNMQSAIIKSLKSKSKKKSIEDVISDNINLIQMISANIVATGKAPPGTSFNDLVSYGTEGLAKAWENFDAGRGIQFKVYASYRVRGEILDRIRKEWKYRNPAAYKSVQGKVAQATIDGLEDKKAGVKGKKSEEEEVKDVISKSAVAFLLSTEDTDVISQTEGMTDPADTVVDQIELSRERRVLWDEVKDLDEDEKQIITMFYIEDKTQKEIAKAMGYSKSKISRMHADVLQKLKLRLRRRL